MTAPVPLAFVPAVALSQSAISCHFSICSQYAARNASGGITASCPFRCENGPSNWALKPRCPQRAPRRPTRPTIVTLPSGQHRRYTAERFAAREQRVLRAHGRPSSAVVETELGLPRPEQWQAFLWFRGGAAGLPKVFSQYCFLPIAASAAPRGSRFSGFRFARSALLSCLRSQPACAQSVGNEYCLATRCPGETKNHAVDFVAAFCLSSRRL